MDNTPSTDPAKNYRTTIKTTLLVIGTLVLFLFALELLITSLQHLGSVAAEMIVLATSNPFRGLFIGLLITAMIQSSSTTTSMAVALVASGSITLESAIPIIMGANVGTTITSTIIALGFINKKKEFKRAVAAGTYHDFFNILTVIVLFPLQYYYGFLSNVAEYITHQFAPVSNAPGPQQPSHLELGFSPIIDFLISSIDNVFVIALAAFGLLFVSIILFRKIIANILLINAPDRFSRFFFRNHFKAFLWGLGTTAVIRSSTVTTSLVVPLVAKRIATLSMVAPFIVGANLGTTITAFIAALLNANTTSAFSLAIAHLLFNVTGFVLFFLTPGLRKLPIKLAKGLGTLNIEYRLAGFVYLLLTFFIIPFSLIYFNQEPDQVINARYQKINYTNDAKSFYRVVSRMNQSTLAGESYIYQTDTVTQDSKPDKIALVSRKQNILFIDNEMHLFNKPGFCWDGENARGKYQSCVEEILPSLNLSGITFDSVYVYRRLFYDQHKVDSTTARYFVSVHFPLILKKEILDKNDEVRESEQIIQLRAVDH